MTRDRLYRIMRPEAAGRTARTLRGVHHAMVAAGIGIMLADTEAQMRQTYDAALDLSFHFVCLFFAAEYVARLFAAASAPGGEHRAAWRSRLAWALSLAGVFDLLGALPGLLDILFGRRYASLFGFVWVFKLVRYSPGLTSLGRVISNARHALLSVLLGFGIVLLAAASLAYLFERRAQPEAFGSIPAALWWAIATLTTTGYGDVVPRTAAGRALGGVVMVSGILVFALWAGILATGYAEEMRRRAFLRNWDLVAKVPFFHDVGAAVIAEVTRLLQPRDFPSRAFVIRRGEPGDCMYFIVSGEVEVRLRPESRRLKAGDFFGEMALLSGSPRSATIVAVTPCTLLSLDIVHFRELLARQPELARAIREEAERRRDDAADEPSRHGEPAAPRGADQQRSIAPQPSDS
ncbi:MAG TPA: cyclic nucleotide-gated ion channel [Stellaceae bacterium]|nr:cyclic nucleotide-gated ion channel [Stellaceae bacterium]